MANHFLCQTGMNRSVTCRLALKVRELSLTLRCGHGDMMAVEDTVRVFGDLYVVVVAVAVAAVGSKSFGHRGCWKKMRKIVRRNWCLVGGTEAADWPVSTEASVMTMITMLMCGN